MQRPYVVLVAIWLTVCFTAGYAQAPQYPIMEKVVLKVIAKYQNSTCAQLQQQKLSQPLKRQQ